jgi:hypothetical protein
MVNTEQLGLHFQTEGNRRWAGGPLDEPWLGAALDPEPTLAGSTRAALLQEG